MGFGNTFHNNTLCLMEGIHARRDATERWEEVKNLKMCRITIDFFHCGLVFFRKEQAPQHFTIRR
jgi:hypothetical protein